MSSADSPTPPDNRPAMTRLLDRPNRPATIAESTKASAESRVLRREPQFNLLIFRCGAEWFAVPADFVVHVSKVTTVHTLPHRTNSSFRGLTALSGAVIPVIDFVGLNNQANLYFYSQKRNKFQEKNKLRSWSVRP